VCWLLLGFFGKGVQDRAEDWEASLSLRLAAWMDRLGLMPDHKLLKRTLNVAFIGFFVAWVCWGVFDVEYGVGLTLIWATLLLKKLLEMALYPAILPWRQRVDARWPKPFAAYR
jgi:hypothetical protein